VVPARRPRSRRRTLALEPAPERELETRLAGALALAQQLLEGRAGRVVLASDGAATDRDPRPALRALRESGHAVASAPLEPPELADLALVRLELPREVEPGAPLSARLELRLAPGRGAPPREAEAVIELEAPSGARTLRKQVALEPALARREDGALAFDVDFALGRAEPGVLRVRARATLAGGDPIPEDDARAGAVACGDALRAIACAPGAGAAPLASAAGFDVVRVDLDALAPALADADLLVTRDVDARELPAAVLAAWLRSGGAWLDLPGERTLAGWRARAEAAALLPLALPPRGPRERTIELLVDASGSMSGAASAAVLGAAIELARLAPAEDRVELRFFTDRLEPPFVLSAAGADERAAAARRLLEARAPSGPTRILAALAALAAERAGARDDALVLLLSDGREESGATAADAARARDALAATRARLRAFALGAEPDLEFLALLCAPGEAPLAAADAAELVTLFLRESARDELVEGGPFALAARPPSAFAPDSVAAGVARAAEQASLPPLARLVRAEAAPVRRSCGSRRRAGSRRSRCTPSAPGARPRSRASPRKAPSPVATGTRPSRPSPARKGARTASSRERARAPRGRAGASSSRTCPPAGRRGSRRASRRSATRRPRSSSRSRCRRSAPVSIRAAVRESAPVPGLGLAFAGRLCELRLGAQGPAEASLWLGFPPAAEFDGAEPLELAPAGPGGPAPARGGPGGSPLAPWFLLAGLLCTGVGLWTASEPRGSRRDQAERTSDR
jgi:hypothetical protein